MNKKEDFELPNQAPIAEIPNLKKKDDERKKSGAAWGSAKAGSPFAGATAEEGAAVGARAAASVARVAAGAARAAGAEAAAAAAGASAGTGAGVLAQISAAFSATVSTLVGKAAVMAVLSLLVGAVAAGVYRMMHRSPGNSVPDLGSIASTVKVSREAGDSSLKYTSQSGLLQSAKPAQSPEQKSDEPKAGAQDENSGKPAEAAPNGEAPQGTAEGMAHNLSGSKLSAGLGAQFGAGAAGGPGIPKYPVQNGKLTKFSQQSTASGKGGKIQAANMHASAGMGMLRNGAISSKGLGLLRAMASKYNSSIKAGTQVSEGNSQAATDQYEADSTGGTAPTSPTDASGGGTSGGTSTGGGSTVNPGPGAPTDPVPTCDTDAGYYLNSSNQCVQTSDPGTNATPWQGLADACKALVILSTALLITASILDHFGWATRGVVIALATIAGIMGLAVVGMGFKINSMGGSPLGTAEIISGGALVASAAIVVFKPCGIGTGLFITQLLTTLMGFIVGVM